MTGAHADAVRAACDLPDVKFVQNSNWESGVGSSIALAAERANERSSVEALLLLTVDQFRLERPVVRRLLDRFDAENGGIVASRYAGTVGVPAIFGREHFEALGQLSGDRGAKTYLQNRSVLIDWAEGAEDADRHLPER